MPRLDFYVEFKLYIMIKLRQDQVMIGRGSECDIILNNQRVSRKHALIKALGGQHILEELSTNGTRVNDTLITESCLLNPGDRIYIDNYILIYQPDNAVPENLDFSDETRT